MRKILTFNECEHSGDLENYITDIKLAGGSVSSFETDYDAEMCIINIEVDDLQLFKEHFRNTESYDFCETYY